MKTSSRPISPPPPAPAGPLLTPWTAAWCGAVSPLIKSLVDSGVGEAEGGVGYSSVPTLISFDAGEAQVETKVADGNRLKDRRFLENWIRTEAMRHGARGRGGGGAGPRGGGKGWSLFGVLFGGFKS